ncbi:hypothetical protein [Roseobacter sp. OBYS 0001]|uniref:hypothetical protein n=1 Tax=Roseobacter sp. OBYS 0001 TaxID=882651 RepID=UPI001BBB4DBD|nr:hypothetical protein [Roseobacter sp. OBYS 0001]GIT85435.1 hypothetical protein ROBYS_04510 [Roseobacter sp. OBYS 0001]
MSARLQIAREAWGTVPDWIEALVAACDAPGSSQSKVAARIDRSPGVISSLLRNDYRGNMANLEDRVRSTICISQVKCPALDWITSADCLNWRDQAVKLTSPSPDRVMMFRACQTCPRFKKDDPDAQAD